jgi:hypothetical protein
MKPLLCRVAAVAAVAPALAGCAGDGTTATEPRAPAATVTVTAGATATVTATATASPDRKALEDLVEALAELRDQDRAGTSPTPDPMPPRLSLRVYEDGCGVIRSRAPEGTTYQNLTWSVRDRGGFQVLGRNAETETRYRYFQGGTFTVVLEAFVNGGYRPVSNKVTVTC